MVTQQHYTGFRTGTDLVALAQEVDRTHRSYGLQPVNVSANSREYDSEFVSDPVRR